MHVLQWAKHDSSIAPWGTHLGVVLILSDALADRGVGITRWDPLLGSPTRGEIEEARGTGAQTNLDEMVLWPDRGVEQYADGQPSAALAREFEVDEATRLVRAQRLRCCPSDGVGPEHIGVSCASVR